MLRAGRSHTIALLLVLCLGARRGLADAGSDATRQADQDFQAAHRDFAAGDYEAALRHYQAAYRLAPHPNILYNLALTHERLLDYDAAIAAFARFLAGPLPADAASQRTLGPLRLLAERALRRLRALPARVSASAFPAQVEVSALPILPGGKPGAPRWQGQTPAVFTLPAGPYLLRFHQTGYRDEEVAIDPHVGQALLVQRELRPLPRPVRIEARPRARVYLDDRPLGETPYQGAVEAGPHRLRLERRFYLTQTEPLVVAPGAAPLPVRAYLVQNGRYEMMLGGLLAGVGLGLVGLRLVQPDTEVENTPAKDLYKPVLMAVGGGVLGLGLAYVLAGEPPATRAQLVTGTGTWGLLTGFSIGLWADPSASYRLPHILAAVGGLVGGMAGWGVDRWVQPQSGTVALFNSGGLWGATLGALGWAYLITYRPDSSFIGQPAGQRSPYGGMIMLGSTTLGIGAGVLLANLPALQGLSRQHVALIDLGGLAGGALVGGLGFAIAYDLMRDGAGNRDLAAAGRVGVLTATAGIGAGLVVAALRTRRYPADGDVPPPPRRAGVRLHLPSLSLAPGPGTSFGAGVQAHLTLFQGLW